jgi:hypothetical protein
MRVCLLDSFMLIFLKCMELNASPKDSDDQGKSHSLLLVKTELKKM